MKHFLLLLFLLPTIAFGQTTAIPDANFEQALIDLGYDIGTPDGSVLTANISSVTNLEVIAKGISNLTGIEDFTSLTDLSCWSNQLTYIDVSNNTALTWLSCENNQLTSLDVSNNTALTGLGIDFNQLTSIDVSNNTALTELSCFGNQLTSLDISNNTGLLYLFCNDNQLNCLNLKNGNNISLGLFAASNPNLTCIEVDDSAWSTANWTVVSGHIDTTASFSEGCNYPLGCFPIHLDIEEPPSQPKDLLYITDILGRTTYPVPNRVLFYIYDDGSVEKKIRLER